MQTQHSRMETHVHIETLGFLVKAMHCLCGHAPSFKLKLLVEYDIGIYVAELSPI